MKLVRTVVAEELDSLGADDPSAMRSRRDLQRVHRAMGTCGVLVSELHTLAARNPAPILSRERSRLPETD